MYVHALYESIPRELLSLLLLGKELRSRGISYEIEQLKLASNRFGEHSEPQMRLVPFCYSDSNVQYSLSKVRWGGEPAFNMCWEQFSPAWMRNKHLPKGKMVNTMSFLSWGSYFASLLEEKGVPKDRIFTTGNLRMDLSDHKHLLFERDFLAKTFGLDADKPWILIAWNLNLGNQTGKNYVEEVCKKYGMPYPQDYYDTIVKTRSAHIKYCESIASAFPNHEVILRAHPSGNDALELKKNLGDKFENIHTIPDLDIISWITTAESVVSFSSTAMIEAIAAGVPTVAYEPYPFFEKFGYQVGNIIPIVNSEDEAITLLKTPEKLKEMINWEEYEKWYGKPDRKAYIRLADVCEKILNNVDEYRFPVEDTRKNSMLKNKVRRFIQNHPGSKPVLSWLGHGTRKRIKAKQWIPLHLLNRVVEGEHISLLYPWVSKLK